VLRAVLFDFDGVIVLSEPLHFAAFAEVFGRHGVAISEQAYYDRYLGLTDRECVARILEDFGRTDLRTRSRELLDEKIAAMGRRIERGIPLCPGVEAFVAEAASRFPLAIVSAAVKDEIESTLRAAGLRERFATIVSADDVRAGKPDPEGYRRGVELLRARVADLQPHECLAIEDSPNGIAAAHAAGLRALALPHTRPKHELAKADFSADRYADVRWSALERAFR
jgi:HAD superfamily hydrolase (TIGR01509 family)